MGKIQKMVDYALKIARDDSHGYSQRRRWPSQGTDFDCSSLMYQAAHEAGYNVPLSGYTGTMLADFKKAGFSALPFDGNLDDLDAGDIMLAHNSNVQHTEISIGNGKFVGAHIAETGGVDGQPGDQTGDEISVCDAYIPSGGWDWVLVPPAESDTSKPSTSTPSTSKNTLNGIDIASWQGDLVPGNMTTTDFIIVKATGGKDYTNPYFKKHAEATLKTGKPLGIYHYACERGCEGTAQEEADYFIAAVKPYIGKAALFLDWEDYALYKGVKYAKAWLDRVKEKTGVTPCIYMSKGNCRDYGWSSVVKAGYQLWVAQYPNYDPTDYQKDPWTDDNGYGAWDKPIMFQYTSEGHIKGYYGRLDLNLFYGNVEDIKKLMGQQGAADAKPTQSQQKDEGVTFRVSTDPRGKKWSPEGKCNGNGIRWLAVKGVGKYRVYTQDNGWLPWVDEYDCSDLEYGCAGDGSPITGVEIPSNEYRYAVRVLGGVWYPDMIGNTDTGGSDDTYAGDLSCGIDGFRISRA